MAKFRSAPQLRSEESFVEAAEATEPLKPKSAVLEKKGRAPLTSVPESSRPVMPWDGLDPKAPPTVNQTVRLNDHQHAQLVHLAELEDRSQAQILRRILGPALDSAIKSAAGD